MRQDAKNNKQQILTTARDLFEKHDVANVSMNEIAKTLHIGAGTLYRHYANKSVLCMDLVYADLNAYIQHSNEYLAGTEDTPHQQFRTLLEKYLLFREQNSGLLATVDASIESVDGSPFYSSDTYNKLITIFTEVLTLMKPHATPTTLQFQADMLVAMLKSDAYAFQRRHRQLNHDAIVAQITRLYLEND